ncbi:hypothetical protein OEZ85_009256 [Tetradesmus obliquus]|uniref:TauD/TfdA-like domain-containing protein n=1 Tax=Tetradesmus obliquus TaxID=3088 RepID=A0ABY8U8E8_TETOB|nr:hypothetical protein OEZ85_009256 [Tetradesmus obliquus]
MAQNLMVGVHLGRPLPQSPDHSLINHVINHAETPQVRDHATSASMGFHSDAQADILQLGCKQQAVDGGTSSIVDAGSVLLKMKDRGYIAEVAILQQLNFYRDVTRYQFVDQTGCEPYMAMPPFSVYNGRLWSTFNGNHYELCNRKYPTACSLSDLQRQAIRVFQQTAQELELQLTLQPGDILLLNNHTMLHARSTFKDGPEPHQRRHLIRLWLGCEEMAALAPPHLGFERCYGPSFDPAAYHGLLKPQPALFHVPSSSEDSGL